MAIQTVSVFGASGRQGQAQVRALLRSGHAVRAISRHRAIFDAADFAGVQVLAADYADRASLDRACAGADAVFFQPPQAEQPDRVLQFACSVGEAAAAGRVRRILLNSTMWSPDQPCGQPLYDLVLAVENLIAACSVSCVILRPTVFMDNWLTAFAKPALVKERKYRYPHKPDLRYSPICLDDLARFMVAALDRDDWLGQRLRVAGPQTLTPPQVAEILSQAIGATITYEYQTPMDFGRYVYDLIGVGTGLDRDTYAGYFADFYEFNNNAPQQPFFFDVSPLQAQLPFRLESFASWAGRQDWTSLDDAVGSASR